MNRNRFEQDLAEYQRRAIIEQRDPGHHIRKSADASPWRASKPVPRQRKHASPEPVLPPPAPAPANTDLHEWARQMREAQS